MDQLDRTRPFGQVFQNGAPSGFTQDGRLFDSEGRLIEVAPPAKRRGRPPNPKPENA